MVDLILQYGMHAFEAFFIFVFFLLVLCRGRYCRHHPVPRRILPVIASYQYYLCVAWIALFFSATFLFSDADPMAHSLGFIWFLMSFGSIALARNAFEIDRFKGCRLH